MLRWGMPGEQTPSAMRSLNKRRIYDYYRQVHGGDKNRYAYKQPNRTSNPLYEYEEFH